MALVGFGGDTVPADSPFITSQIAALNGGTITAPIPFGRRFYDFGDAEILFNRRMYQLSTGLDGSFDLFGRGWKWSAYYTYGKTMVKTRQLDQIAFPRYFNALDSTTGPDGQAACRSTLSDPTNGCVPLNPFIQSVSDAVRRYLQFNTSNALASLDQHVASAYATGPLFRLPGGDFSVAAGVEYRRESNDIGATPEFDPTNPKYNADYGTTETPLKGKYSVAEVFGEVKAPLMADRPFFHMLELEAAVREAHYSTAGYTTTWKFGGEWAPIRDVRFRGTYGQAVRAPNISELFTASSIAGAYVTDPCNTYNLRYRTDKTQYTAANCALINPSDKSTYYLYRNIISQGNPDLKVEVARTLTAGIVLTPRFLPGLSLSADYYDIKLRNSIDAFPAQTILNRCVDSPTLQNQFCGFVARDSGGNILSVVTQQLNLAKYRNRGIDFAGSYRLSLERLGLPARWGSLSIDAAYTRLLTRDYLLDANLPGSVLQTVGIFGSPKWKGVVRTSWDIPGANVTWTFRHFGSMRPSTDITDAQYSPAYTGDVFYNDFSVSKSLNQAISLFAGVNNAFDRAPPRIPGAEAGGANFELGYQAGVYDVIGRTIYFGIRFTR